MTIHNSHFYCVRIAFLKKKTPRIFPTRDYLATIYGYERLKKVRKHTHFKRKLSSSAWQISVR